MCRRCLTLDRGQLSMPYGVTVAPGAGGAAAFARQASAPAVAGRYRWEQTVTFGQWQVSLAESDR